MKILVCIKQVPDTNDIKWTENNTIQREGVESIINPYDVYAIEEALKLKKSLPDVEITVFESSSSGLLSTLEITNTAGCASSLIHLQFKQSQSSDLSF